MNKLKDIAPQELILGALSTIIFLNPWLSILTSLLWGLGGSYAKGIRRFGVPIAVGVFTGSWLALLGVPITMLGDGFPDRRPTTQDEGSWLGRQVEKFLPDDRIGGIVTKCIPVILLQVVWVLVLYGL